jgi:hypothetical protein
MNKAIDWLEINAPDFVNEYVQGLQNTNKDVILKHIDLINKITHFETKMLCGIASINEINQDINRWRAEREYILDKDKE